MPGEFLWELAASTSEQDVVAGETVIREGDMGSTLYVVVAGEVAISRGGRRIARIGERDVFGEPAALDAEPRSATVTALVDTRLLLLEQQDPEPLPADSMDVVRRILRTLCARLRRSTDSLCDRRVAGAANARGES